MDDCFSKPKRKPAKSAHPSQKEKEAMTATLEKACLKDERPPNFEPPKGESLTAVPPLNDFTSEAAAAAHVEDYDYGGRYGEYQATRFNSSMMDDRESDARAEYNYLASRCVSSAPGFWHPSTTPTHMATAIVCPAPRHRERAQRRERSTGCNRYWKASSVPQVPPPSPFNRLSVRVSCYRFR
jgi:hypothetical protein